MKFSLNFYFASVVVLGAVVCSVLVGSVVFAQNPIDPQTLWTRDIASIRNAIDRSPQSVMKFFQEETITQKQRDAFENFMFPLRTKAEVTNKTKQLKRILDDIGIDASDPDVIAIGLHFESILEKNVPEPILTIEVP